MVPKIPPNPSIYVPHHAKKVLGVFCGASEAKRHIGITLSVVCLSRFVFIAATCVPWNNGLSKFSLFKFLEVHRVEMNL